MKVDLLMLELRELLKGAADQAVVMVLVFMAIIIAVPPLLLLWGTWTLIPLGHPVLLHLMEEVVVVVFPCWAELTVPLEGRDSVPVVLPKTLYRSA